MQARPSAPLDRPHPRIDAGEVGAILAVCAAVFFVQIDVGHLHGDAIRYAAVAKNIAVSGEWILLQDQPGVLYANKPPLMMWLVAALFELAGVSVWAARLPSALFATAAVLMTGLLGRRLFDARVGWLAAILAASSYGTVSSASTLRLESGVTFAAVTGAYAAVRAIQDGRPAWLLLVGVAAGLGGMLKPVAPLHVYLASGLVLACHRPRWLRHPVYLASAALALLVLLPWHVAAVRIGGGEFAVVYFGQQIGSRMQAGLHVFSGLARNLAGVAKVGLPWSPLFLIALWRRRGSDEFPVRNAWFFGLWVLAVVALMAIPARRYDRYMIVAIPALAIPAAWAIAQWISDETARRLPLAITAAALAWIALITVWPIDLQIWRNQAFLEARCHLDAFDPGGEAVLYEPGLPSGPARGEARWQLRATVVFHLDRALHTLRTVEEIETAATPFVFAALAGAEPLERRGWTRVLEDSDAKYGLYENPALDDAIGREVYQRNSQASRVCLGALPVRHRVGLHSAAGRE